MTKAEEKPKQKKLESEEKPKATIEDVDCILETTQSGNGLLVRWEDDVYISNVEFVSQLIDGTLEKKDGTKAKAVPLGLLTDGGIEDTEPTLFLTMKGKSIYFCPSEGTLLIVPVANVVAVLSGTKKQTKMGKFA